MLNPLRLQKYLQTQSFGRDLLQLAVVDSTNRILSDWLQPARWPGDPLRVGTTLIATQQKAGRGQYGRVWHSPPGGLYLSLVLEPQQPLSELTGLTLALVWGVVAQLRHHLSQDIGIKWPNDLVAHGKKLGGLLLQTRTQQQQLQSMVVGLGLNIRAYPEAGDPSPLLPLSESTNLQDVVGMPLTSEPIAAWVLLGLEQGFSSWQQSRLHKILPECEAWLLHRYATINLGKQGMATVLGVAPSGALRVQTQTGEICLMPGEIRLQDVLV
ncbi:MAG: biotin--[acetyl-CoA-carboxylase] ligase [Cyanobacteriota bacterium]|nr:biotin--[acetyl-CoA-carboxylase] ligase [Cyanobacteriota bacterium]